MSENEPKRGPFDGFDKERPASDWERVGIAVAPQTGRMARVTAHSASGNLVLVDQITGEPVSMQIKAGFTTEMFELPGDRVLYLFKDGDTIFDAVIGVWRPNR